MKIYIGADHAGFKLKESLKKAFSNYKTLDLSPEYKEGDDYPDIAAKVARTVVKNKAKGILLCGTAEGVCIAANKIKGIRAVAVWSEENARLSRQHNNANILCLSGWQLSPKRALDISKTWIKTKFSGKARHKRRLAKIARLE